MAGLGASVEKVGDAVVLTFATETRVVTTLWSRERALELAAALVQVANSDGNARVERELAALLGGGDES